MQPNNWEKRSSEHGTHRAPNRNVPRQDRWYPTIDPVQAAFAPTIPFVFESDISEGYGNDNDTIRTNISLKEHILMTNLFVGYDIDTDLILSINDCVDNLFDFDFGREGDTDDMRIFQALWNQAALIMLLTWPGQQLFLQLRVQVPPSKIIKILSTSSDSNFGFAETENYMIMPNNIDSRFYEGMDNKDKISAVMLFHELVHAWHHRSAKQITNEMLYTIFISGHFLDIVCAYFGFSDEGKELIKETYMIEGGKYTDLDDLRWMSRVTDAISVVLKDNGFHQFVWDERVIEEVMTVNPQSLPQGTYKYLCNLRGIPATLHFLNENTLREQFQLPPRKSYF